MMPRTECSECQRCRQAPARRGEKYCRICRRAVLAELREAGFLAPRAYSFGRRYRPLESRENTNETKYGPE